MCCEVTELAMAKFLSLKFHPSAKIPFPTTTAAWVILIRGDYEADRSCQLVSSELCTQTHETSSFSSVLIFGSQTDSFLTVYMIDILSVEY
jgi:hypothetical protein